MRKNYEAKALQSRGCLNELKTTILMLGDNI